MKLMDRQLIKMLRDADQVSFFHEPDAPEEKGLIRVGRMIGDTNFSGEFRVASEVTVYDPGQIEGAFESILFAKTSPAWCTVVDLLQHGDVLELRWTADNNTTALEEAGFHSDELALLVRRGKRLLWFNLAHKSTKDNCSRLVRLTPETQAMIA